MHCSVLWFLICFTQYSTVLNIVVYSVKWILLYSRGWDPPFNTSLSSTTNFFLTYPSLLQLFLSPSLSHISASPPFIFFVLFCQMLPQPLPNFDERPAVQNPQPGHRTTRPGPKSCNITHHGPSHSISACHITPRPVLYHITSHHVTPKQIMSLCNFVALDWSYK